MMAAIPQTHESMLEGETAPYGDDEPLSPSPACASVGGCIGKGVRSWHGQSIEKKTMKMNIVSFSLSLSSPFLSLSHSLSRCPPSLTYTYLLFPNLTISHSLTHPLFHLFLPVERILLIASSCSANTS